MTSALLFACAYPLGRMDVQLGDPATLSFVQPERDRNRWYVVGEDGAGERALWFVDTGYTYSTCDDDFVDALGVRTRGRVTVRGELGRIRSTTAMLPPIELGSHEIRGLSCVVRDLDTTSSIRDPDEVAIAGVLGIDVFRRFHTTFDAASGTVRLSSPEPSSEGLRVRNEVPFVGRAVVRSRVDGKQHGFILDTGATGTYLNARRAGLLLVEERTGVEVRGTGTNGSAHQDLRLYRAESIELGGVELGPWLVVDRKKCGAGLLGLDLLGRLRAELDLEGRSLSVEEVEPGPVPRFSEWLASPSGDIVRLRSESQFRAEDQ